MKKKGNRKTLTGVVVSDKMDKTIVVKVETMVLHPHFKKYIVRGKRYKAHDEQNKCNEGDRVQIEETRPLSRGKRWTVRNIIERAPE